MIKPTWLLAACLLIAESISANVTLPAFFGSGMVLQRDQPVYIWGWADKGEKVTVQFKSQKQSVKTGSDGKWMVKLKPEQAGGPFVLTVNGKNNITCDNVMMGDVWICSGQSNMEWHVKDASRGAEEIQAANYPQVREFTVKRAVAKEPLDNVAAASWLPATPENVGSFSAVSYFFGRELYKDLQVPIGLIHTSWGGTQVEAWISKKGFLGSETFKDMMSAPLGIDSITGPNGYPACLFNAMIHPLLPYGIKGAIWYQGESNAGRAYQYRQSFPLMITDWRNQWRQGDFPFYFVQLSSFDATHGKGEGNSNNGSSWAELREAQAMTLSLPNTGMAVITDIGERNDIHPRNKQDVGKRLAWNVLKNVYAQPMVAAGPAFKSMDISGNKALISFTDTGSGLVVKDRYGYLKGFEVAGADQHFHYAKAAIVNGKVEVYSDQVTAPVAVRYNWADDAADGNLFNREGLPAAPFRTDKWKGVTDNAVYQLPARK
ncbi:sialate O-acetylesterase [Chitinophaga varians]|uniref:sialate O-acetylesterase n=1 Tax=Chitinophaga varians TaxID=2202339 RepID=UPI00165F68D2|nr:sialate O-acetylesterase [Chitinophaga varians]MBC9914191.1 sialate O-acetylesterase [Chitinophaga varians]